MNQNSQFDIRASIIACFVGCIVFPLSLALTSLFNFASLILPFQVVASLALGPSVISAENGMNFLVSVSSISILMAWCFAFGFLINFLLHRWGILVGIFGGALLGLCAYAVSLKILPFFFEWSRAFLLPSFAFAFALYGAFIGGVYEALEEVPPYQNPIQ